ncbi:uncharacterized protein BDZ99DRAFT_381699 [Mytilinidion resinicola]|uniref:Cupin type-1 domain-containing protein n=1 Tax=Mytilinidion resinicola TaxID=574789 RepID=A0A6A6YVT3_9PEZI|nr:uncharacterized protein BDZ99DRAFT_381699 [Mytilinidion resinicola]KAF2813066.1 hypothetical protein BDZ99DRAFT_381699 [Mytilinidion resinicola]
MTSASPEVYRLSPTPHVPNSVLPVLLYRSVLPPNPTADSTRRALEKNLWMQGGVFKTYTAHHFHSVTHECYAVFKGSSRLLLGRGPLDDPEGGKQLMFQVSVGDIIVLPAGVSHCSLHSEGEYEYVGLYPQGSPHWDNNFCKKPEETAQKAENARAVPVPEYDPIHGKDGPLVYLWQNAAAVAV